MEVLRQNARVYGDLVHFRGFDGHIFQFNHPELIREIFVEHERRNRRALVMQRARALLGDGLLTSEEPLHMRQRRLAAPAFHRQRIAGYGDIIGRYAEEVTGAWQDGVMDVHEQTLLLALRIVGKCLFNIDEVAEARRIADAVARFMVQPPPGWIAERRRDPGDRGDLLSMLLAAEDTVVSAPDREVSTAGRQPAGEDHRMSDRQVRDECLTVLLAGHETTANALSFALWLLAKHPEAQEQGHREATRVLGRRTAAAADFSELRYTFGIFAEACVCTRQCGCSAAAPGRNPTIFTGSPSHPAPCCWLHRSSCTAIRASGATPSASTRRDLLKGEQGRIRKPVSPRSPGPSSPTSSSAATRGSASARAGLDGRCAGARPCCATGNFRQRVDFASRRW